MKNIAIILGTLFMAFNTAFTQNNIDITQLNGKKVEAQSLTNTLQLIVDTGHITGLSVVIIENNKMVYNKAFGYKNLEAKAEMDTNTIMYAASFTKPLFSTLFLQLVGKGIFELDKPVFHYLKNPIETYEKWKTLAYEKDFNKITPRMILSHCSGLPVLRYMYGDSLYLIAKPGEKLYYSNEAFNFLGFIVEDYTGKKLDDWARELLFEPLGMTHSGLVWHPEFKANYAVGHDADGNVLGAQVKPNAKGAGSLVTTPADYANFLIALFQKQLLSETLYNDMLKPQIYIHSKRAFSPLRDSMTTQFDAINLAWGLGIQCFDTPFGRAYAHGGHLDGWQNKWIAYPKKNLTVLIMSNSDNMEKNIYTLLEKTIGDMYAPLEWNIGIVRPEKKL